MGQEKVCFFSANCDEFVTNKKASPWELATVESYISGG